MYGAQPTNMPIIFIKLLKNFLVYKIGTLDYFEKKKEKTVIVFVAGDSCFYCKPNYVV